MRTRAPAGVSVMFVAVLVAVGGVAGILSAPVALASGAMVLVGAAWLGGLAARRGQRDAQLVSEALDTVGGAARSVQLRPRVGRRLRSVAAAVDATADRLEAGRRRREADDMARRELLASVAHDLGTPLASLTLLASAIEDEILDARERSVYARRMHTHLETLSTLTRELLDLARVEASGQRPPLERVDLEHLVEDTLAGLELQAQAAGVRLRTSVPPGVGAVSGRRVDLARVLLNLVENAIRHTPPEGTVVVRVMPDPDGVEIEVADSGPGIPAEARERVFRPFARGSEGTAPLGARLGLGLAIARAIVDSHGGQIWLDDATAGARVRMRLPVAGPLGGPMQTAGSGM